jgi:hypothetical protein
MTPTRKRRYVPPAATRRLPQLDRARLAEVERELAAVRRRQARRALAGVAS